MQSPYLGLAERCLELNGRSTRYRFDLDDDIPWDQTGAPGLYYGPRLLADLGVDVEGLRRDPEAFAAFDWASALATCLQFIELERGILAFVGEERARLGPMRSAVLLCEDEEKHIEMFVRYADHLRAARPELVGPLERAFYASRSAPFDAPERYPDPASYHYAFWLSTLFFEDYTIYLHQRLADEAEVVQPAWLVVHAKHRREEEQHVVTDVAHIDACALDGPARKTWSRLAYAWLTQNMGRFLALDPPEQLIHTRFPELELQPRLRLADTGLHADILAHRLFRRTRAAWPHLAELATAPHAAAGTRAAAERAGPPPGRLAGPRWRGSLRALSRSVHRAQRVIAGWARHLGGGEVERFDLRALRAARVESRPERPSPRPAIAAEASGQRPMIGAIRAIWAEVLELPAESIGDDDSFTALGGDSLQAVAIHTAIERHLGHPLCADMLFECRTVRDLADFVAGARARPPGRSSGSARARSEGDEPIAIVALAGRFPGAAGLDELWQMCRDGRDAFRPVPDHRWDAARCYEPAGRAPGKTVCTSGAFLDGVDLVDPAALGLDESEAAASDPQHRIFLELAGDLLEAGGGTSRVGVFASAGWNEYFAELRSEPSALGSDAALGNLDNMIAARVSQLLRLSGPAFTVNAACASSHLAIHLACQSLRAGECDMAIAGAAQLYLSPVAFVAFSQAGVLSPTQRCRPFSAAADGFVPGEGAGLVLLKPLDRALADGDLVLAVIRGSAVNNDAGSLSGMAPSPRGQVDVLRAAYASAEVSPDTVDLVEAHGTGTSIGDAVEVQALAQVFGRGDRACALTSLKSNVGHLMTAAGVGSVIKVVLALQHGELPPLAGFDAPNPRIDFSRLRIEPVSVSAPWPSTPGRPRRAGVTGLGIGGTNVHLVLEEAPPAPAAAAPARDAQLVCVSAPDAEELSRVAGVYADRLEASTGERRAAELAAVNRRASRFPCRRAVVARSGAALVRGLRGVRDGCEARTDPRVVFVFSGPGSQYLGMARPLHHAEPVFRTAIDRCSRFLGGYLPRSLETYLFDDGDQPPAMDRIEITQPIIFAVGYALARWLDSLGIRPAAVIGHSAGEYVAACAAGGISLEQALMLVTRRGAAMSRAPRGKMAAAFAGEDRVRSAVAALGRHVSVAAVNDPAQVVLSGESDAVDGAMAALEAAGIASRELAISCAAHCPLMASAQREFAPFARSAELAPLTLPLYSTVTGRRVDAGQTLDAGYWVEHLCAPVQFAGAIAAAAGDGLELFLEVGASGGLVPSIQSTLAGGAPSRSAVPLLRRAHPDSWEPTLSALGKLVEHGVPVDLRRLAPATSPLGGSPYPYRRRSCWLGKGTAGPRPARPPVGQSWELSPDQEPHSSDHLARGRPIAPGARLMELALEAAADSAGSGMIHLADLIIARPLSLADGPRCARARIDASDRLEISSDPPTGATPVVHLTARILRSGHGSAAARLPIDDLRARCGSGLSAARLYEFLATTGMRYGPTMRTVTELSVGDGELLARLEAGEGDAGHGRRFHPGVVDGAMQALAGFAALDAETIEERPTFLGFSVGMLTAMRPIPARAWSHARLLSGATSETLRADITIAGDDGSICARFADVGLKRVRAHAAPRARRPDALALLRPAGVSARELRKELEENGVFVVETESPADRAEASELFARIGPIDGVLLVAPSEATTRAVCGVFAGRGPGSLVDLAIAAPVGQHDSLLATVEESGWRGPRRALAPDAPFALPDLPAGPTADLPAEAQGAVPRSGEVAEFLRCQVAAALRRPANTIDSAVSFARLGLDSLMAVEMVLRLEHRYGLRLYPTLLFEYPTIGAVAAALQRHTGTAPQR